MTNFTRAAIAVGAGLMLLAAGKAPETVLGTTDMISAPAPTLVQLNYALPVVSASETDNLSLGSIEDATSLSQAVARVPGEARASMDQDMKCLAIAIYYESKGEPLDGQLAVAEVILNRVESGRYGKSICDVVKAPRQFSFVKGGVLRTPPANKQFETATAIAWIAQNGMWDTVAGRATHFHATYVRPGWKLQRIASIGNHIFYR